MASTTSEKFCIVGAGSSGLATAKNFLQGGIPFDCLEREDDVGGNWYYGRSCSSVYESTHLISSKQLTEFTDFPMPREYPEYPNHQLVLKYLRRYANHFGLYDHIQFNTNIQRIEPLEASWRVTLGDGSQCDYCGVVIANGHNWDPRWPNYPGEFTGEVFHSSQYKTPDVLRGKRVLVVGGGNSGSDLAVEASIHAATAMQSVRRGYHILPKFFKGIPVDKFGESLLAWHMPLWARRLAASLVIRWVLGPAEQAGLRRPDHRLFASHPVINSRLHYSAAHGDLTIKPDIEELAGDRVRFVDGTEAEVDVIIYATGFRLSFPFLDRSHLNWSNNRPNLFLNVFHPHRDNLFCIGLIQPDSGQWGLIDYQAQLVTRYLQALANQSQAARWFSRLKSSSTPRTQKWRKKYVDSPRHRLEVEHFSYRRELQRLIAKFA